MKPHADKTVRAVHRLITSTGEAGFLFEFSSPRIMQLAFEVYHVARNRHLDPWLSNSEAGNHARVLHWLRSNREAALRVLEQIG